MLKNKTLFVMDKVPVKNETGNIIFNQCRPKLHYEKAKVLQFPTSLDIESRLRHNLRLIRITRGPQ